MEIDRPIGRIRSPFTSPDGSPIQPAAAPGVRGFIEIDPEYAPGLRDLDGFSHVIVLWHMHLVEGHALEVVPFLDDRVVRGAPRRHRARTLGRPFRLAACAGGRRRTYAI